MSRAAIPTGPRRRSVLGMLSASPALLVGCQSGTPVGSGSPATPSRPVATPSCGPSGIAGDMDPPSAENVIDPHTLTLSGDGSEIATFHGRHVVVFSTGTGRIVRTSGTNPGLTYNDGTLAWSPTEALFARDICNIDVALLDSSSFDLLAALDGHTGSQVSDGVMSLSYLAFSRDGALLASSAQDRGVVIWNVADRTKRHSLKPDTGAGPFVAFSPDGARLITGDLNRPPQVWDVSSGEVIATLEQVERSMHPSWSPDGALLAFSDWSGNLHLYDGDSLEPQRVLQPDYRPTYGTWTSDGARFVTATEADTLIGVWEVATDRFSTLSGDARVERVATGPDPDLVYTGDAQRGISAWSLSKGEVVLEFERPTWE